MRTLKELGRSYLTMTKDLTRVMSRIKALYRSWAVPCSGSFARAGETYVRRRRGLDAFSAGRETKRCRICCIRPLSDTHSCEILTHWVAGMRTNIEIDDQLVSPGHARQRRAHQEGCPHRNDLRGLGRRLRALVLADEDPALPDRFGSKAVRKPSSLRPGRHLSRTFPSGSRRPERQRPEMFQRSP